jgi:Cdc6-like AAA superfamily ATPase
MLSYEEKLLIGLNTLKRFKATLRSREFLARQNQDENLYQQKSGKPDNLGESRNSLQSIMFQSRPSLQAVLQAHGPWAQNSCVVGICDDGLPFVLDLTDPRAGGLLILGDPGSGKTRLLNNLLASTAALNGPGEVLFHIFAQEPQEFEQISQADNCQNIFSLDDPAIVHLLEKLALFIHQRQRGSDRGPTLIVAIDNLASFLQFLPEDAMQDLYTLITQGSSSRVWVIASLPSTQAEELDEQWLSAFSTLIFGAIHDQDLAKELTGDEASETYDLYPGYQFSVPFGEAWLRFWVCESEEQF